MTKLTQIPEWQTLKSHYNQLKSTTLRELFAQDKQRFAHFSQTACGLLLDYSRNLITPDTLDALIKLGEARELKRHIQAQFSGENINNTERRPALHTALRDFSTKPLVVNGKDVKVEITAALKALRAFTDRIHNKQWLGATGKPIKHIVNIGIGGSYTGPMMAITALQPYAVSDLNFHFLASVDEAQVHELLAKLDLAETLCIISSKSFTTIETLTNARTVIGKLRDQLGTQAIARHVVAVTAAKQKAEEFGILAENIFPLWEWVGGRYSVWSAIGLPLMLQLGTAGFDSFLAGAHEMDQHFIHADFKHNMPVILALLGIWYNNFFDSHLQAIIPYAHRLRYFIAYLQQADMESNGKAVDSQGHPVDYATGPVIFGEEGVIGQHAYHQLLHQGNHFIPTDFIVVDAGIAANPHQDVLLASALSQAQALMCGKTQAEARKELEAKGFAPDEIDFLSAHQVIPGNKPSNIICMHKLTPKILGSLLALYEHKIFVQGVIWGINSFDQWGVELGKQLLPGIMQSFSTQASTTLEPSLAELIHYFRDATADAHH
jgi:glucose-6-phosphate isomerase